MTSTTETVALAFSGGLDTTVCVPLLKEEYGYDEVLGVTVDVGQPAAEFDEARETAEALGLEHVVVDAKAEFAELCLDSVRANATYQGYPLGTALARPVIAEAIADAAREHGASALAHGCTGKGNDQLRFEAVWRATEMDVIAPVRELGLTREWESEYAAERELPVEGGSGGRYSIDTNLWSRSIEGSELEDPATIPEDDIYDWTATPGNREREDLTITFEDGRPITLDGENIDPVALIETLNERAGAHGVGRTDMMEDRMLGLKVRENYEHPAATVLLTAHEALEQLVFTAEQRQFKTQIDQRWAEKAYEGLIDAPLVDDLEGFLDSSQQRVTGTVTVRLEGGQVRPVARESEYAVYSESAASFDESAVTGGITQDDATGVAKYHGFQDRLARSASPTATTEDDAAVETPDGGD
ncbi:argininosuccinate synthase [Halococcoides cellulosivorans]|uniref:Argininosuccinate synthase n=1 Tax=Halococcoides cellulosivorans TaxID=1679096 RepID=A0A2R4WY68_9EURY|nr:argininosuccinate synthase [Halococcoides cellulosivorans]AWB26489.1 argininosuccinate synthase [Halococcoides cellulosivorans]